ncbi:MAG: hypothetical protein GW859_02560 [Sphingomonadales bacterium]|nr:hypothetical protein [Sphingomonadales bacterium]
MTCRLSIVALAALALAGCQQGGDAPAGGADDSGEGARRSSTSASGSASVSADGNGGASAAAASLGGTNGAYSFAGTVVGRADIEHLFNAEKGQTIDIKIDRSGNPFFNVIPPGGDNADAIFVGSDADDPTHWRGTAPASGVYRVLVYLRGQAKDAEETRPYAIAVGVR